jgi:hypothetical protein
MDVDKISLVFLLLVKSTFNTYDTMNQAIHQVTTNSHEQHFTQRINIQNLAIEYGKVLQPHDVLVIIRVRFGL